MESQPKHAVAAAQPAASLPYANLTRILSYVFRSSALALSFIAAIVLGVAREKLTVFFDGTSSSITLFIKSTQFPAYVYLLVVNVLVLFYSILTLALSIMMKRAMERTFVLPFCVVVGDLVAAILLFSANGASAAITMVGDGGQDSVGWSKICDYVDGFCGRVKAGIVLSMLAATAYALLVLVMFFGLHKRSQ